jgi:hypothetical protein
VVAKSKTAEVRKMELRIFPWVKVASVRSQLGAGTSNSRLKSTAKISKVQNLPESGRFYRKTGREA